MDEFLLQMVLIAGHKAGLVNSYTVSAYRYYETNDNLRARFAFRADNALRVGPIWYVPE